MKAFFWSSIAVMILYRLMSALHLCYEEPGFYKRIKHNDDNKSNKDKEIELQANKDTKHKHNKKTDESTNVEKLKISRKILSIIAFLDWGVFLEVWNGHVRNDSEMSRMMRLYLPPFFCRICA